MIAPWPLLLLLVHAGATAAMAGLIAFVQWVHYPLFGRVGSDDYTAYANEHVRRTTPVVAPLMLTEMATAVVLLIQPPPGVSSTLPVIGLVLLAIIWLSTAALQVPCHRRLEQGFDAQTHRRLVNTNQIRTVAWFLRTLVAAAMLIRYVSAV